MAKKTDQVFHLLQFQTLQPNSIPLSQNPYLFTVSTHLGLTFSQLIICSPSLSSQRSQTLKNQRGKMREQRVEIDEGGPSCSKQEEGERSSEEAALQHCWTVMNRSLQQRRKIEEPALKGVSCIFEFPERLKEAYPKAHEPEMVSIGPYHRGKAHLLEFEDYKWFFLEKEILRTREFGGSLLLFIQEAKNLEESARGCYSDVVAMSSTDFIQMMILDGLFIIEFFRQICESVAHDSIIIKPSVIPILMADLLKIENQLPFSILVEFASITMASLGCGNIHSIYELVVDVFRQFILMPKELSFACFGARHLLELFYLNALPRDRTLARTEEFKPSHYTVKSAGELKLSGLNFKKNYRDSFLDVTFQPQTLLIPPLTLNCFTSVAIVNCVAWEQQFRGDERFRCFTEYATLMNFLITQPKDISCLSADGIILNFSQDDQLVVNLFDNLAKNSSFSRRRCYLSREFREIEAFYNGSLAYLSRSYFSSPLSSASIWVGVTMLYLASLQTMATVLPFMTDKRSPTLRTSGLVLALVIPLSVVVGSVCGKKLFSPFQRSMSSIWQFVSRCVPLGLPGAF